MKARIKKTGEIVNIQPGSLIAVLRDGDEEYNSQEYKVEEVEILPDGYEEVRVRAAIAAMQGIMNFFGSIDYNRETIAKLAVEQANALIAELKKK